jgi:hypothetical protein
MKFKYVICVIPLVLFACDLKMPEYIRIKGNPRLNFPTSKNFSDMFSDSMGDMMESDELTILEVKKSNDNILTYVIHKPVINEDIDGEIRGSLADLWDLIPGPPNADNTKSMPSLDDHLLIESKEPIIIELKDMGDFIEGFVFKSIESRLYTFGSNIMNHLKIEIEIKYGTGNDIYIDITEPTDTCGFNEEWESCPWTSLPTYGKQIGENGQGITDAINKKIDIEIEYKVFIKQDNGNITIYEDWQDNAKVRAELGLWIPLDFVVDPDEDKAVFHFSGLYPEDKDLFGRTPENEDTIILDMVKSMSIVLDFIANPFKNAVMHIDSEADIEPFNLQIPLGDNGSFIVALNEDSLDKINQLNIFAPQISIHFNKYGELIIPKVFKTSKFSIQAEIDYTVNLGE